MAKARWKRDSRGKLHYHVPEPMTPEARARLDARGEVDRWRLQWGRLWARIGVEQMRPVARRWTEHISTRGVTLGDLLFVALADYKLRFPQARGDRMIVSRPVNVVRVPDRLRGHNYNGYADYHCRFCGRKLTTAPKGIGAHPPHLEEHARVCAVLSLAGVIVPVPPGHTPACEDPETLRLAVEQLSAIVRAVVLAWANDVVEPLMMRVSNLEMS